MPAAPSRPQSLAGYLEALSRAVFQSGFSWQVVEAKWSSIRDAFHGFDPAWVAALTPAEIDRLALDPRVIRNRAKIEGTADNARALLDLDAEYGGFGCYLRSFADYQALAADVRKRFRFIGDSGACHFLWQVGEPVPDYDTWQATR